MHSGATNQRIQLRVAQIIVGRALGIKPAHHLATAKRVTLALTSADKLRDQRLHIADQTKQRVQGGIMLSASANVANTKQARGGVILISWSSCSGEDRFCSADSRNKGFAIDMPLT